tara:strand:- start:2059 stop:2202 length:144 start_codon:yes stop_codon:yes gene_type:complete
MPVSVTITQAPPDLCDHTRQQKPVADCTDFLGDGDGAGAEAGFTGGD